VVLTRFWHRRIAEATFLIALVIIGLYFLPQLDKFVILKDIVSISTPALVAAVATAIISVVLYVWVPKKLILEASLTLYILIATMTTLLIVSSGDSSSPFVALWLLVAIFAGVFSISGFLVVLVGIGAITASEYLHNHLDTQVIVKLVLIGAVPMIASFLVWRSRSKNEGKSSNEVAYKDLANELSEVATKSEVVINAIGDGVIAIDNQDLIQLINPAAQQILGWGKQDALTLNYKSILHMIDKKANELDQSADPVAQVQNTNQQIRTNDLTILTRSGKKLLASLVVSPIGQAGSGVIVVFRDITKETTESREQAEFISTASHEMRTPVASIEGYLGLALNPNTATIDDKARDFIMKAHESAEHLGRLFQDLLDVSKADDGRMSNVPKVVDMIAYTHDILEGLQEKADEKGLQLIYKPIPNDNERHLAPVYSVNLDNDHIREIINNLTENAIKYTPKGQVIVDVTGTEDKVVVSVQDSGIGIPAEDMPHLFQKFYRVDNVDTREIGGTGLGLYLCRRLAETLGGRIWVESEYKKGSTFYVELPRIDNQEAERISAEQEAEAAKQKATPATAAFTEAAQSQPVATAINAVPGAAPAVAPASTVPRGESLTPEQIAEHVAKLRAMAQAQTANTPQPAPAVAPVAVPVLTPITPTVVPPAPSLQPVVTAVPIAIQVQSPPSIPVTQKQGAVAYTDPAPARPTVVVQGPPAIQ
jgi:PAS domain S-box-containing protein